MEITEAGRRLVESPEFAQEVRRRVRAARAQGVSGEFGEKWLAAVIALGLTGHLEGAQPQAGEVRQFLDGHAAEIKAAADRVLENLVAQDCGSGAAGGNEDPSKQRAY